MLLTTVQVSILQQPAFCVVRSLIAFRLTSTHKDYSVVGTDAGKVTILEYLPETSEVRTMRPHTAIGSQNKLFVCTRDYMATLTGDSRLQICRQMPWVFGVACGTLVVTPHVGFYAQRRQ